MLMARHEPKNLEYTKKLEIYSIFDINYYDLSLEVSVHCGNIATEGSSMSGPCPTPGNSMLFEQFGVLYVHNLNNKHPTRSGPSCSSYRHYIFTVFIIMPAACLLTGSSALCNAELSLTSLDSTLMEPHTTDRTRATRYENTNSRGHLPAYVWEFLPWYNHIMIVTMLWSLIS